MKARHFFLLFTTTLITMPHLIVSYQNLSGRVTHLNNLVNKKKYGLNKLNDIIRQSQYLVVDFYADWCGPCRAMNPTLQKIAQENSDITIIKVNVDTFKKVSNNFNVHSMPTLLFFKNGTLIHRSVGKLSKKELKKKLHLYF